MLRISKLADYGTVVMVYLARQEEKLASARDIALHTHLAMPTVSKLLKKLTKAGLLLSVRGVNGGYKLYKMACDITISDIIYALDDSRGLTECSQEPNFCSLQNVCSVQNNWRVVSQAIESALQSVSLKDLTNPSLTINYKFGVSCGEKK